MTRRVRPDELELWRKANAQTQRLHPAKFQPDRQADPAPAPPQRLSQIQPFQIGALAQQGPRSQGVRPGLSDTTSAVPLGMDRKSFTRMKRGKLRPEARLDLHGMTLDRAHGALLRFIPDAQSSGKRLVLVITGKGKRSQDAGPIPQARGLLRRQVPHWLTAPPLSHSVLQIAPAHVSHGGEGAYYVYLRRGK